MTALEAIFATSATELTHRLAERVAVFLGHDGPTRLDVYDAVKEAYSLRSTLVHGAQLKPKLVDRLAGVATTLDGLLRDSLLRILSNKELYALFNGENEALDQYFLNRLLG